MPTRSAAHIQHPLAHLRITEAKERGNDRILGLSANRSHLPDIPLRIAWLIDGGPVGLPVLCGHECISFPVWFPLEDERNYVSLIRFLTSWLNILVIMKE